ncbi:GntR family transcriptional regulator [Nocardioides euryhalodurans]|uniref:GntR family transcriptional regulator n=1 Tax=Nocardioides euryhalodurans TaxID=2518370 RepID=A0A4V1BEG4_9ACTN|nr:GntR family transcriptional regulator [Nocardioides euryhalodurans]
MLRLVRRDIVAGVHPPGSRLTEASLTKAYGGSRVPVREALKQLEVEGFVTSRAYAGVTVAHMHADEAAELFTVRRTIEQITVKRCAQRFRRTPDSPEVIAFGEQLEQLVVTGCGAVERPDRSDLPPLNTEFHLSLAAFSGSASMLSLLRQVSSKIEWLYAMDVDVRGPHSWTEHREIADAVRAGRVGDAGRLMRQHIANSLDGYLLRHTPGPGSAP